MTPRNDNARRQPGEGTTGRNDGPDSAPTMPMPATRRAAILEALRRGERLTHADALARGWGWRLAADVFKLREYGWPIHADMIDQGRGHNPIARYRMR